MKQTAARIIFIIFAIILILGILSFPIRYFLVKSGLIYDVVKTYAVIENDVSEALLQPGCFYDTATNTYRVPGVTLGADIYTIANQLGMKEYVDLTPPETLTPGSDTAQYSYSNNTARIRLYDNDFWITYYYKMNCNCYMLEFSTALIEPDEKILRTEQEAYDYVSNVFDKFYEEYGVPSESNYPYLTLKTLGGFDQISDSIYAVWKIGEAPSRSYMLLQSYLASGDNGDEVYLKVYIGIEADDIDMDEIMAELISYS